MVFIEFHLGNMHYARAPYYHASNNQDTSTCNSSFAPFLAPNFWGTAVAHNKPEGLDLSE